MLHHSIPPSERHAPWSWVFSTHAERLAADGFASTDVNKLAWQASDNTAWALISHSPVVWVQLGGSGSGGGWTPTLYKSDPTTPCLLKTGAQTLAIKAGTVVKVGASTIPFPTQTNVSLPTLAGGEDYSVWVRPDGVAVAVADPYPTPAAPPVTGAVKIGGFHYGLVAPGTTVAGGSFATTGTGMIWTQGDVDKIAGINEWSLWDLTYRPRSDPRGMACIQDGSGRGLFWVDLYFCSTDHISNGTSRYNTAVASGTVLPRIPLMFGGSGPNNYSRLSWYEANEIAISHRKRLMSYEEFAAAAFGTTEGQSLGGAASTIPTTTRQPGYTSKWGIEQVTGNHWTFGADGATTASGSGWVSGPGRGNTFWTPYIIGLGGSRGDSTNSGSRCASFSTAITTSIWSIGLRCAADHFDGGAI